MAESEVGIKHSEETNKPVPEADVTDPSVTSEPSVAPEDSKNPPQMDLSEKIKALTEKNARNRELASQKRERNAELLAQLDRSLVGSGFAKVLATEAPTSPTVKSLRPTEPSETPVVKEVFAEEVPAKTPISIADPPPQEVAKPAPPQQVEAPPIKAQEETVAKNVKEPLPVDIVVELPEVLIPSEPTTPLTQVKALETDEDIIIETFEEYRVKRFERPVETEEEPVVEKSKKSGLRFVLNLLFFIICIIATISVVIAALEHITDEPFEIAGYTIKRVSESTAHAYQENTLILTTMNNGREEVVFSSYAWGSILAFFESSLTLKILAVGTLLIVLSVFKGLAVGKSTDNEQGTSENALA